MILQALKHYYDILVDDPKSGIAAFGYSTVGVSYALNLSTTGELLDILPMFDQEQRGKKMVEVPRPIALPQQVKRSVNIAPNFLWDNSAYVLGLSELDETKPAHSRERFNAFRQLHKNLLSAIDAQSGQAVLAFLARHEPTASRQHPVIAKHVDALLKGGNLVFQVEGAFVHDDPAIRRAWELVNAEKSADLMQCLVTGEIAPIARLHPNLKRVRGAQPSGATLVGFNASAYESYNRTQGLNSPIGEAATFAYTTALNYLLSDANPNKKFYWGDTTVVYWAESENRAYESAFASMVDPEILEEADLSSATGQRRAETALKSVAEKVKRTQVLDLDALLADLADENPRFYVLGLAPNSARVSVRFFIADPFTTVVENIMAHYRDMAIIKEFDSQPTYLTVRYILNETVSAKSKDKEAAPLLSGAVLRAILMNTPYPAALYYALLNRVRADMDDDKARISKINYARAAVIKAFLLRKYRSHPQNPFQEVLTVPLNEQSTSPAYLLGRLFAVLEKVQQEALGDVNASIKDRYFTSACAAPASVFPVLLRLSHHHIAKAESGTFRERQIESIVNQLDVEKSAFPAHLTLDEQGVFILGYYHQRKDLWTARAKGAANAELTR
jgi:CRISPR-associated protein Csd1